MRNDRLHWLTEQDILALSIGPANNDGFRDGFRLFRVRVDLDAYEKPLGGVALVMGLCISINRLRRGNGGHGVHQEQLHSHSLSPRSPCFYRPFMLALETPAARWSPVCVPSCLERVGAIFGFNRGGTRAALAIHLESLLESCLELRITAE